jgi:hypothetical protein
MPDLLHLILHVRAARSRAREAAAAEAASLLSHLGAEVLRGGPLSERPRTLCMALPAEHLEPACELLPRLGYTEAADLLEPAEPGSSGSRRNQANLVRWKRREYWLRSVFREDVAGLRELAPDRRSFLLESADGEVREVAGYRGEGVPLKRRALPVCDARLLANLAFTPEAGRTFLDPFAGIAGILLEARALGFRIVSCDNDPALRRGLARSAEVHCVADAAHLPLAPESIHAVATEPPFASDADAAVLSALAEISRVLKPGGKVAMMCGRGQARPLRRRAGALKLEVFMDTEVDRKGTAVNVLGWTKPRD